MTESVRLLEVIAGGDPPGACRSPDLVVLQENGIGGSGSQGTEVFLDPKIAWNAVFGRFGAGQGEDSEGEGWEDVEILEDLETKEDLEALEEREREKKIKRGQLARAAARVREANGTSMPPKKDTLVSGQEAQQGARRETRRMSVGRTPVREPTTKPSEGTASGIKKRKNSINAEQARRLKAMEGQSAAAEEGRKEEEETTNAMFKQMKAMMEGLTASMGEVKQDVGAVKRELGEEICKGNEATLELKKRMDHDELTFDDRVAKVIRNLPQAGMGPSPTPVFSGTNQSSIVQSYASCVSSTPGPSSTLAERPSSDETAEGQSRGRVWSSGSPSTPSSPTGSTSRPPSWAIWGSWGSREWQQGPVPR